MLLCLAFGFVLPLVTLYVIGVRAIDRYEPEPIWLLLLCFVWGATASTIGSILVNLTVDAVARASFEAVSSGAGSAVDPLSTGVFAPIIEESIKGFGMILVFVIGYLWLRELDGPVDGVVYGGMIGLGFTLVEDTLYIANSAAENGAGGFLFVGFTRTVLLGLGHALYTSLTGFGWGMAVRARSWLPRLVWPTVGFLLAIATHAARNFFSAISGGEAGLLAVPIGMLEVIAWMMLLVVLVYAERKVVARQLAGEVGGLVRDDHELDALHAPFLRGFRRLGTIFGRGPGTYWLSRRRDKALFELAMVKDRRERVGNETALLRQEEKLRARIATLNAKLAARP